MWVYLQNFWPFKFDDLRVSDRLVKKLSIPDTTKHFVYAVHEPQSQAVIYVLCIQNLSERSVVDVECLIREVKPDAVIAQVGPTGSANDFPGEANDYRDSRGSGDENVVPTSSFEVLRRCFVHRINREKYENVAGSVVLKEIFGVGFNGHLFAAKKAAEEAGSSFLLLESPFVKCSEEQNGSGDGTVESGNGFQGLSLQTRSLVPHKVAPMASTGSTGFWFTNDIQFQTVKALTSYMMNLASTRQAESEDIQPQTDYEPPQFARSVYPLLQDLHDIFSEIPSMGKALAHAQRMLSNINQGEIVNSELLSEVYTFQIAVEGLRVALNTAGRLPLNKLGPSDPSKAEFSGLPIEDKSHALLAQALRSQTKKFKSIVAVVDAGGLAGLRRNWNVIVPHDIKDMIEDLVTEYGNDGEVPKNSDRGRLLTNKPVVAVGAGATAVLGASSLSKVVPASSFIKIITLNVPSSLKLMLTQTQKAFAIFLGKSLGPSKVVLPGMVNSGVKTSALKAAASAEKIRAVAHSVIASAERTSLSAMRTAFYEIMRTRHVRPVGFLPLATFGCSMATCTGLLVYGDGIECAAESLPTAPSIASLGRGIQSLHQASEAVKHSESSRIQKTIESLFYRFKKIKIQQV